MTIFLMLGIQVLHWIFIYLKPIIPFHCSRWWGGKRSDFAGLDASDRLCNFSGEMTNYILQKLWWLFYYQEELRLLKVYEINWGVMGSSLLVSIQWMLELFFHKNKWNYREDNWWNHQLLFQAENISKVITSNFKNRLFFHAKLSNPLKSKTSFCNICNLAGP